MEQRFETFTVLVGKLSRSIKRLKSGQMAQLDLKGPHVSCLYYLYSFGPMTAAELCERCEEDKAAISRSLEYLESSGYLHPQAGKRYRAKLLLTPTGQQAGAEVARRINRILEAAGAGLSEQEREIMYRAMEKISVNLENIIRQYAKGE